jgi:hypothetical protein
MALRVPKALVQAMVPESLQMLTLPITLPYDLSKVVYKLSETDDLDKASLQSLQQIWNSTVEPRLRDRLNEMRAGDPAAAQMNINAVLETLREANIGDRAPAAMSLGRKLTVTLLNRAATRLKKSASKVRDPSHSLSSTHSSSSSSSTMTSPSAEEPAPIADSNFTGIVQVSAISSASSSQKTRNSTAGSASPPNDQNDLDSLEMLLAERLGGFTANTANRLASLLEDS